MRYFEIFFYKIRELLKWRFMMSWNKSYIRVILLSNPGTDCCNIPPSVLGPECGSDEAWGVVYSKCILPVENHCENLSAAGEIGTSQCNDYDRENEKNVNHMLTRACQAVQSWCFIINMFLMQLHATVVFSCTIYKRNWFIHRNKTLHASATLFIYLFWFLRKKKQINHSR